MSTTPAPPDSEPVSEPEAAKVVVGWREWVALPQAGVDWVKAKIDTGARSSSIHAFDLEVFAQDDREWVRFSIHPWQRSDDAAHELTLPLLDRREVRSSNGQTEERYAVDRPRGPRARVPRRLVEVVRRRQAEARSAPQELGQVAPPGQRSDPSHRGAGPMALDPIR